MQDRFKFRIFSRLVKKFIYFNTAELCLDENNLGLLYRSEYLYMGNYEELQQCTGLKDKNGNPIYEGDIIVIPSQYPFYDYKNIEDRKQNLNETKGEIKGESILNYIGIVEWIYSQWQYVYHCVNPEKNGISEGINCGLNDFGFKEGKNTPYEVIGNIYENPELLGKGEACKK